MPHFELADLLLQPLMKPEKYEVSARQAGLNDLFNSVNLFSFHPPVLLFVLLDAISSLKELSQTFSLIKG